MRPLLHYTIASQLIGTCAETFSLQSVFSKMNLSDTSRESSVNSARFDEVENDIEHQTLNLSVTSSIQSSTNTDGLNVQDSIAENRRLTQENDDLKRRFMKEVSEKLPFSTSQLQELSEKYSFGPNHQKWYLSTSIVRISRHFLLRKERILKMFATYERHRLLQEDSQPMEYP